MKQFILLVLVLAIFAITLETVSADDFKCVTKGRFADPDGCQIYHLCRLQDDGSLRHLRVHCPAYMAFDKVKNYCTLEAVDEFCYS